jgi:D-glycero-D-manno-heptose 1,7-bisphosphate phosphatase
VSGLSRHLVDGVGLWRRCLRAPPRAPARPALFLDRDGVVLVETGFVHDADAVALVPAAGEVIGACNRARVPVVLVTNQSGIARGLYGWAEFAAVQARLEELLRATGAWLDMVLACAYYGEGAGALAVAEHPWRKPAPGMLLAAAQAWPIDLARSWIVGDRVIDLAAGRAAGLAGGMHVLTGHGADEREKALALATDAFAVLAVDSIAGAGRLCERLSA